MLKHVMLSMVIDFDRRNNMHTNMEQRPTISVLHSHHLQSAVAPDPDRAIKRRNLTRRPLPLFPYIQKITTHNILAKQMNIPSLPSSENSNHPSSLQIINVIRSRFRLCSCSNALNTQAGQHATHHALNANNSFVIAVSLHQHLLP